eukprot:354641-Chlamydomonas_euryale.AAC.5
MVGNLRHTRGCTVQSADRLGHTFAAEIGYAGANRISVVDDYTNAESMNKFVKGSANGRISTRMGDKAFARMAEVR